MLHFVLFCIAFAVVNLLPALLVSLFVAIPYINALGLVITLRLFFPVHNHKSVKK